MTEKERAEMQNLRRRLVSQRDVLKRLQGKAAEIKPRGRWICVEDKDFHGGGYVLCSECRHAFSYGGYLNATEEFLYCPHCGVRIDGDAEE